MLTGAVAILSDRAFLFRIPSMSYPTVTDDGTTLELDLHGATVDLALLLVNRAIREARHRGRSSIRIIHGRSTSDANPWNRTIKHALYDELDAGAYDGLITGVVRLDGAVMLSFPVASVRNDSRISIFDLQ